MYSFVLLGLVGALGGSSSGNVDNKATFYADQTIPDRYRGKSIYKRPAGFKEKVVALTFDDGPDPSNTPKIVGYLAKYKAKATFFVIGSYANRHKKLVRFVAENGHVVGSHTWSHKASPTKAEAGPEIWKTARAIHSATGVWPSVFRPPYGINTNRTSKVARMDGYGVIIWDRSSADTVKGVTSDDIYSNVWHAQPGNIVLLHDGPGKKETVKAVPAILKTLDKRGYKVITVPDMLRRWDAFLVNQARKKAVKKKPK